MYEIKVVLSSAFDDNNDVELTFENYSEAVKYAKKMIDSYYSVEINKVIPKE